ncbi:hypothetical protein A1O3_07982 [Capronia epimyces CBS 606.96]|uniref:Uncharacterized protein n=1 Tax=Capronia epimyces CBS 606.96 TaxID=1182542 RepID=W9XQT7_9EURO|nr:uncharacterized protein A1O3_07982 [Capronia epimyces CBS 606.96]EXJ79700.1 hypothetical protein A1O3_07982 [Capronia epimyces CBS 606.96]
MFVSPYSAQTDPEVQEYNQRRAEYLAAKKKQKQDERLLRKASIASTSGQKSSSAGHEKGGRGLLKKLFHAVRATGDKDGMSQLTVDDNADADADADAKTLVDETGRDLDQVSVRTAVA